MSMLEELFGVDEADEAEALERVIEGGSEDDERRGDDEAEEDKRTVDPTKPKSVRVVKNPHVVLNAARLTGPRGLQALPEHFKDFKFKGKGREQEDLDLVLKKLEHWAHRLYPKFKFHDCLKQIETLGKKRPVMVTLRKIRSDQLLSDDIVTQRDSSDDETPAPAAAEDDEFDQLLQQQIELARSTPARGPQPQAHTPATESPAVIPKDRSMSEEQRLRMLKFRQIAEERRLARMRQSVANTNTENNNSGVAGVINFNPVEQLVSTVIDRSEVSDNMNTVYITCNAEGVTKENVISTGLPASDEDSDAMETIHITDNTEVHLISGNTTSKVSDATDKNEDSDAMETIDITDNAEVHLISGNTTSKVSDATDRNEDSDAMETIDITDNAEVHLISGNTTSKVSDATDRNEDSDAMDTGNITGNTEGNFHSDNSNNKESDNLDTSNSTGNTKGLAIIENSSETLTLVDLTSANITNTANSNTLQLQQPTKVTNISTENESLDSWDGDFEMQELEKSDYGGNIYDKEINKSVSNSSKERMHYSDSSDDECRVTTFHVSVAADVHNINVFSQDSDDKIENPTQSSKDKEMLEDISIERGKATELSGNDGILEDKSKEKEDCILKDDGDSNNVNKVPVEDNTVHFEEDDIDWNSIVEHAK